MNGDCFFNCPQSLKPPLIVIILIMSPVGVLTIPVFFHIKFGVLPFEALRGRLSVLGLGEPLELGYNQRGAIRIIKRAVWFLFIIFMVWELNRPFYYHADVLSVIRYVYLLKLFCFFCIILLISTLSRITFGSCSPLEMLCGRFAAKQQEQETKRPLSEQELALSTSLRRDEVRAVPTGLGDAGLARPRDSVDGVWELSHGYVARAAVAFLRRWRRDLLQLVAIYVAPALLAAMLLIVAGVIAWDRFSLRTQLAELGLLPPLRSLDLGFTNVDNLESLKGLTALEQLNLANTKVDNLEPLRGSTALQTLILEGTRVHSLEPLKGLTALKGLNLEDTKVDNLEPLKGLTRLDLLGLNGTQVDNLEPLKGLTRLELLALNGTRVDNLEPLKSLRRLEFLYLKGTRVDNLEPLKGLTRLKLLCLTGTPVNNLEPLKGLTALRYLAPPSSPSDIPPAAQGDRSPCRLGA